MKGVIFDEFKMRPSQTGYFVATLENVDNGSVFVRIRHDFVNTIKGQIGDNESDIEDRDMVVFAPNCLYEIYIKNKDGVDIKKYRIHQEEAKESSSVANNIKSNIETLSLQQSSSNNIIYKPNSSQESSNMVQKEETIKKFLESKRKTLLKQIKRQMEYYFGDKNYTKDKFLQDEVNKSQDRFVSLDIILSFNKMKNMNADYGSIVEAITDSKI